MVGAVELLIFLGFLALLSISATFTFALQKEHHPLWIFWFLISCVAFSGVLTHI
jgi:uncharacterized membrane protein (DUF106 family)